MTIKSAFVAVIIGIVMQGCGSIDLGEKEDDKPKYIVAGTVSGLSTGGTLVLQNNDRDDLQVAANGAFIFPTALSDSSSYSVTVKTQPAAQTCTVTNGMGRITGANVTNAVVACEIPTGPSGHTVSFSPTTPTASSNYVKMEQVSVSGDTVTIAVKAVNIAEGVGGLAVYVIYDTSHLEYVSAVNGDVIANNFMADERSTGEVVISASDVPDASPSANGTLFTITFKGTATGSGSVVLQNNSLFNASGNSINGVSWYGGTVTVQ